ncbi:MAG: thioredoxin [Anaerolineae bacterium]
MGKPFEVSDDIFQAEVIDAELPTVVDFWAPWCGPCRMIAPIVEELAEEYEGKINFAKLNVDNNPQTSIQYNVQGIPTLIIFAGGREVDRIIGAVPKKHLEERLKEFLAAVA